MLRSILRPAIRGISRRPISSFAVTEDKLVIPAFDAAFPYVWLRDACTSPTSIDPSTSQKLFRTSDIPLNLKPASNGVSVSEDGLDILWQDGHRSHFSSAFLERHAFLSKSGRKEFAKMHKDSAAVHWDAPLITATPDLFLGYQSLDTPSGLLTAINHLERYGLIFVTDVPTEESIAGTTVESIRLGQKFSEIRETFYGRHWNVQNIKNSNNIAYTNLFLGLHMDLQYFQHPPRYQLLQCLRNNVQGGQSIFVDSFKAASILQQNHPSSFDTLCTTLVPFHYINDGHHLHFEHPTIVLNGPEGAANRSINHVNYSPPFQAPFPLKTDIKVYDALKKFGNILDNPEMEYRHTLREGDTVIFDNRRVLHARTAFSDISGQEAKDGETNRWLQGCYIEGDSLWDKGRTLRAKLEHN